MLARLSRTWAVGEDDSRDMHVGLHRDRDSLHCWPWELLSIACDDGLTAELFEATISLADEQGTIGPVHLPCLIHLPGSTRIMVRPVNPVSRVTRIASVVTRADSREARNYATWSTVAAPGDVLGLPQWVRGVGSQDSASFVFVNRAGVDVSTPIAGATDRPHLAASVRCITPGILTFYY